MELIPLPDGLWICDTCGYLRSDPGRTLSHDEFLRVHGDGNRELLIGLPDPVRICRDCALRIPRPEARQRFEALVERYSGMTTERYQHHRQRTLRVVRGWHMKQRDSQYTRSFAKAYSHLVLVDQLWCRNHPRDYRNTMARVWEAIGDET